MAWANPADLPVESLLQTLGIDSLCQWDLLVFLYRHHVSLVNAEHIARLLGYPTGEAVTALDTLESLGLVKRSRVSQGVRLYQFTGPADPPRADALDRLITLTESRAARLLLAKKLQRGGLSFAPPSQKGEKEGNALSRLQCKGRPTWRKAI
jgi:hypothetical protein